VTVNGAIVCTRTVGFPILRACDPIASPSLVFIGGLFFSKLAAWVSAIIDSILALLWSGSFAFC
jgi:hypothetical protein